MALGKRLRRRILSLSVTLMVTGAVGAVVHDSAEAAVTASTYSVDATGGSDSNAGTSTAAPWKSLAK